MVDEFGVHHLVALHTSQSYLHRSAYHVEYEFLRRASLHACAARYEFRTRQHLHSIVGLCGNGRVGVVHDTSRSDALGTCVSQRSQHKWRGAACRDAHHDVLLADSPCRELRPAVVGVVLARLSRLRQTLYAARENGLYLSSVDAVGVLHLNGVESGESSARAASHIKQSAAAAQLVFHGINQSVDGRQRLVHSHGHRHVLAVDIGSNLFHAHLFQMVVVRWLLRNSLVHISMVLFHICICKFR